MTAKGKLAKHMRSIAFLLASGSICATSFAALSMTGVARYSFAEPQSTATQLSGISYIGNGDYYAISDHVSQLYTLHIAIDSNTGGIDSFSIDPNTLQFYTSAGVAFGGVGLGAEGVADDARDNVVYVSNENLSNNGPDIYTQSLSNGYEVGRIDSASAPELNVYANCRTNLGWESMTREAGTGTMWTMNQAPLKTDGATASLNFEGTIRLQRFDAEGDPTGQFAYHLDDNTNSDWTSMGLSCVSDLLALPDGNVIALERASGSGRPGGYGTDMRIRLYEIGFSNATDLDGQPLNNPTYVTKTLLWEHYFDASNNNQFEGITLGPTLANGNSSVVLIADNQGGTTHTLYTLQLAGLNSTPSPQWFYDDNGNWNNTLNWAGGVPSGIGAAANFLSAITAPQTITVNSNETIGSMTFNSGNGYTITGPDRLTLQVSTGSASIYDISGTHTISAPLTFASNSAVTVNSASDTLSLIGGIATSGHTVTKSGNGTVTISGAQVHTSGSAIVVTAGTLNLNSNAGSSGSAVLGVSASNGTINFGSRQDIASLTLNGGRAFMKTTSDHLFTHSLSISNGGTLDLSSNDVIIDYTGSSPIDQVQAALTSGYNDGRWNGTGMISSAAANNNAHDTTLAFDEASDLYGLTGSEYRYVDGEFVDSTTVIIKYTWIGDLNMDGVVDGTDLYWMSPVGTTNASWAYGDFNYDGVVNADDYALFQYGLAESGGKNIANVPEPALQVFPAILFYFRLLKRRQKNF
ncbi:MAG TPA: esterase-like activity of phytase family protein [Tepidisphaeraceae bacterium]|nr:esterase-like activity of phytase family protein [Tepidisphaeraceae bacterium]